MLHGDAGGGSRSSSGPRAWVDEEYKALHGLRLVSDRLKDAGRVEVIMCLWYEIRFID